MGSGRTEPPDPTAIAWIAREILPHEGDVRKWVRRFGANGVDEDDVIQEAYCRLAGLRDIERVKSARAYFFTAVRNIILEQLRRGRVVHIDNVAEIDRLHIVADEPSPERNFSGREELAKVQRLIAGLPERCRMIFTMRKVEGLSQREIAQRMGVTENVVEKEVAKGLRILLEGTERAAPPRRAALLPIGRRSKSRER
jgi:RNA polymerase sigma-70 factor (ECF subfamily)